MTVSIRAARKVTVRRFAKAAVVAALLLIVGAAQALGDDTRASGLPQQCANLKQQQHSLAETQESLQTAVGNERLYFERVMQMTPAQLDSEIQGLKYQIESFNTNQSLSLIRSPIDDRQGYMLNQVLNFLMDLRANQSLGPELGATTQQMQARANRIVKEQQAWANNQQQDLTREIHKVDNQIAKLDCANVPSVNQSVDTPQSGKQCEPKGGICYTDNDACCSKACTDCLENPHRCYCR